jgi:hypothetical protein
MLGIWPAVLAQKPGPHGLGLLVYGVKAQSRRLDSGLSPTRPYLKDDVFRGGSGLIFWARVGLGLKPLGLGFFGLLKFEIWLEAFKLWALITGLNIL